MCQVYDGWLDYTIYSLTTARKETNYLKPFRAYITDLQWKITVVNDESFPFIRHELSYDGEYLYLLSPLRNYRYLTNRMDYNAHIKRTNLPFNYSDHYFLWFALASGDYLRSLGTNVFTIPTLWMPSQVEGSLSVYLRVKETLEPFGTPKSADFYASKDMWREEMAMRFGAKVPENFTDAPFPDNFKCAEYAVTRFFPEQAGATLPMEIVLKRYYFQITNMIRTTNIILRSEYTARITNVSRLEYGKWVPALSGQGFVTDYRFSQRGAKERKVGYINTNAFYPPTNAAVVLAAYEKSVRADYLRKRTREYDSQVSETIQKRYTTLFVMLAMMPIIAFRWFIAKTNTTNK